MNSKCRQLFAVPKGQKTSEKKSEHIKTLKSSQSIDVQLPRSLEVIF